MQKTGGYAYFIRNAKKTSKQHCLKSRNEFNIMNLSNSYLEKIWKQQNRNLSIYRQTDEFNMDEEKSI